MKKLNEADLRGLCDKPECPIDRFCKGLEYAGRTHKRGYFHYTKWSSFSKMVRPVHVSDSSKLRHVIVTKAPWDKNDLSEGKLDRRYWYVSFTYLLHEVVSMWVMYGKGSPDAVRLQFSVAAVKKWAAQEPAQIKVYKVPEEDNGEYKLIEARVKDVKLLDVGYYAKYSRSIQKREGVLHRTTKYKVDMPRSGITGLNGSQKKYAAYLKKAAWAGEQEVRLLIEFDTPVELDRIAIAFDEPIKDLAKHARKHVVTSPWLSMEKVDGLSIGDCARSMCKGMISYR